MTKKSLLNRSFYQALIIAASVGIVSIDILHLVFPPGTFAVWRLIATILFLLSIMMALIALENRSDVAMGQHNRMWKALVDLDPDRAKIANEKGDFDKPV